jgi:putative MATE family efflux protein
MKHLFGPGRFYLSALALIIPVMLQSFLTGMVSLIDNFMVAALGDGMMAGVNVANQINFVYIVIVNTICMAGGIYLSQHKGAQDRKGMQQAFRFKIILATAISVIHLCLSLFFAERLIGLLLGGNRAQAEIIREGARYLRVVAPGFIPIGISTAIGSSFRDTGVTKVSLAISVSAAFVNTFLNWVLIYGNLGAPRLEVTGAALATVIARFVEAVAFMAAVRRNKPPFAVPPSGILQVDRNLFREILAKSSMMLFSETAWVMSETIITALYNSRGGKETVAGMAAGWTIANLFFLVFPAIQAGTGVILGSTLGAGNLDEGRVKALWIRSGSFILGMAAMCLAALSTLLIPLVFANLSREARLVTRGIVFVIAVYLPVWCLLNSQFAVSRSGGDTVMGLVVDVGISYLVFLPAAIMIAHFTAWGPVALYGIAKISDFPKVVLAEWWISKERWVRNLAMKPGSAGQAHADS